MSSTMLPFTQQPGDQDLIAKFKTGQPLDPDEQYRLLQIAQAEIAENDREQRESLDGDRPRC